MSLEKHPSPAPCFVPELFTCTWGQVHQIINNQLYLHAFVPSDQILFLRNKWPIENSTLQ